MVITQISDEKVLLTSNNLNRLLRVWMQSRSLNKHESRLTEIKDLEPSIKTTIIEIYFN